MKTTFLRTAVVLFTLLSLGALGISPRSGHGQGSTGTVNNDDLVRENLQLQSDLNARDHQNRALQHNANVQARAAQEAAANAEKDDDEEDEKGGCCGGGMM